MTDNHEQHKKETEEVILHNVEKHGCHLALVEADNYLPAFVFSIGLYKNFGHPEIICFGLKTDMMATIINHARDLIKQGEAFEINKLYSGFLGNYDIQFIEVKKEHYADYLGYAGWFYDMSFDFPVLQLIWPDKQNHYPWDENFNPDWKFKQPLLDRNIDFKFYEDRNVAVFTTKQAFKGDPILRVYHGNDGEWQFHTSLSPDIKDTMIVVLESITKLDPSINDLYHLQYGWRAFRGSPNEEWQFEEYEEEDASE